MHISQNKLLFFLSIDAFFHADSESDIKIFRTALFFESWEEKERKNRHNKTQVLEYFSMLTYEISSFLSLLYYFSLLNSYENSFSSVYCIFGGFTIVLNLFSIK